MRVAEALCVAAVGWHGAQALSLLRTQKLDQAWQEEDEDGTQGRPGGGGKGS